MVCLMAVLLVIVFLMSLDTSHGAADLINHCHAPGKLHAVVRECVYVSGGRIVASEVSMPSSVYCTFSFGKCKSDFQEEG